MYHITPSDFSVSGREKKIGAQERLKQFAEGNMRCTVPRMPSI
jgi:hypothetical protein